MIKLFKVKEKQRELAENASNGVPTKKQSAGELRLHKGLPINRVYLVLYIQLRYNRVKVLVPLEMTILFETIPIWIHISLIDFGLYL